MDPLDLDLINNTVGSFKSQVVIQLSTFSANNANRQEDVIDSIAGGLRPSGTRLLCVVKADGNMMSLLLGRNVEVPSTVAALPDGFSKWLSAVKMQYQAATTRMQPPHYSRA